MARTRILIAAATAAALLAAASPALARAPSVSEQGSLEWVLLRIKRDREAEKGTKQVSADPLQAFEKGEVPLEDWKAVTDRIKNRKLTYAERERATSAVLARFKAEAESGKIDPKAVTTVKRQICRECLELMIQDDENNRNHIQRLLKYLLPDLGVSWSIGDTPLKRQRAYNELRKKLRD